MTISQFSQRTDLSFSEASLFIPLNVECRMHRMTVVFTLVNKLIASKVVGLICSFLFSYSLMMLFSYVALLSYLPLLTFGRKRGTKALTQPLAQWLCSTVYARGLWASKLHRGERDGAEAAVDFAEVVRCHAAAVGRTDRRRTHFQPLRLCQWSAYVDNRLICLTTIFSYCTYCT